MKMKSLAKQLAKGRQDMSYKETLKLDEFKLKITIKSDSYNFQSHARIEIFDNLKWNHLESVHYDNMKTPAKLYYHSQANEYGRNINKAQHEKYFFSQFKGDRDELVKLAKLVLA